MSPPYFPIPRLRPHCSVPLALRFADWQTRKGDRRPSSANSESIGLSAACLKPSDCSDLFLISSHPTWPLHPTPANCPSCRILTFQGPRSQILASRASNSFVAPLPPPHPFSGLRLFLLPRPPFVARFPPSSGRPQLQNCGRHRRHQHHRSEPVVTILQELTKQPRSVSTERQLHQPAPSFSSTLCNCFVANAVIPRNKQALDFKRQRQFLKGRFIAPVGAASFYY